MRASAQHSLSETAGSTVARPRVLYAEDQQTSRVVTTAVLKRLGYDVVAVEDGEYALNNARAERFDLILLDIEMPVMDGVTAARALRQDAGACRGVPIIALSAFLADSTEHTGWRDAFDFALPKPANQDELRRAINRVCKPVDAKPLSRSEILASLKNSLPKPVWSQVLESATSEMRHLANAIAACREAGDHAAVRKCAANLIGLAQSFEARSIVEVTLPHSVSEISNSVGPIHAAIDGWRASAV